MKCVDSRVKDGRRHRRYADGSRTVEVPLALFETMMTDKRYAVTVRAYGKRVEWARLKAAAMTQWGQRWTAKRSSEATGVRIETIYTWRRDAKKLNPRAYR